tara:strand:+ start:224 stop:514 length:291 start_codon:yes stop_codon:yes gene_type:complete
MYPVMMTGLVMMVAKIGVPTKEVFLHQSHSTMKKHLVVGVTTKEIVTKRTRQIPTIPRGILTPALGTIKTIAVSPQARNAISSRLLCQMESREERS